MNSRPPLSTPADNYFVTGGTLSPLAPSYLERAADEEIYQALLSGEFCYVLTSRQMGKSSLLSRAAMRLRQADCRVSFFELSAIGINLDASQWFDGILERIGTDFDLEDEIDSFRERNANLGPLQMWLEVMRRVILNEIPGKRVVIIVDEIDLVRSLRDRFNTDEFFAGIRELYNRRAHDPELRRLTFCLLGVASPGDLMADKQVTPFNIGRRIELRDFTRAECAGLARGFSGLAAEDIPPLLDRIHHWTGGQPYLTQQLAKVVAQDGAARNPRTVDALARGMFLSQKARETDSNLTFVRDRVLKDPEGPEPLLRLYRKVLKGRREPDSDISSAVAKLKLSGLLRGENGVLHVKNLIYRQNFNLAWVRENLPHDWARTAARTSRWAAAILLFACLPLAAWAFWERHKMDKERHTAMKQRQIAEQQKDQADIAREAADNAEKKALKLKGEADKQKIAEAEQKRRLESAFGKFYQKEIDRALEKGRRLVEARLLQANAVHHPETKLPERPQPSKNQDGDKETVTAFETRIEPVGRLTLPMDDKSGIAALHPWQPGPGMLVVEEEKDKKTKSVRYLHLAEPERLWRMGRLDPQAGSLDLPEQRLVRALLAIPDGNLIFMADFEGGLQAWDTAKRSEHTIKTPPRPVISACALPGGSSLIVALDDGSLLRLSTDDGAVLQTLANAPAALHTLAASPDGASLLGGGEDGRVWLWHLADGRIDPDKDWKLPGHITALAFQPDGSAFLIADSSGALRFHNSKTGLPLRPAASVDGGIESAAWSPDGRLLLTGGRNGRAILWEWPSDAAMPLKQLHRVDIGKPDEIDRWQAEQGRAHLWLQVAFRPNGRSFVAANHWDRLAEWDTESAAPLITVEEGTLLYEITTAFAIDQQGILYRGGLLNDWHGVFAFERRSDRLHRLTQDDIENHPLGSPLLQGATTVAVSQHASRIAWSARNDAGQQTLHVATLAVVDGRAHIDFENAMEFLGVSSSQPEHADVARSGNAGPRQQRAAGKSEVSQLAFSVCGRYLAAGLTNAEVTLFVPGQKDNAPLWKRKAFEDGASAITTLGFLQDGAVLIVGAEKAGAAYDTATWEKLEGDIVKTPMALADDGINHVFAASDQDGLRFLRLEDDSGYSLVTALSIHLGVQLTASAIAANGRWHVHGLDDGRVALAIEGQVSETIPAICGRAIDSIAFAPGDHGFITGCGNVLQFWRILPKPRPILADGESPAAFEEALSHWNIDIKDFVDFHSRDSTSGDDAVPRQFSNPEIAHAYHVLRQAQNTLTEACRQPHLPTQDKLRALLSHVIDLPVKDDARYEELEKLHSLLDDREALSVKALDDEVSALSQRGRWFILNARLAGWEKQKERVTPNLAASWHAELARIGHDCVQRHWLTRNPAEAVVNDGKTGLFDPGKLSAEWKKAWERAASHLDTALAAQVLEFEQTQRIFRYSTLLERQDMAARKSKIDKLPSIDKINDRLRGDSDEEKRQALQELKPLLDAGFLPQSYILVNAGIFSRQQGDFTHAWDFHRRALNQARKEKNATQAAYAYVSMAYTARAEDKPEKAAEFARQATKEAPDYSYAWIQRMDFEITTQKDSQQPDLDKIRELIREFSKVTEIFNNNDKAKILFQIAAWHQTLDESGQAKKAVEEGFKADASLSGYKAFWEKKWTSKNADDQAWAMEKLTSGIEAAGEDADPEILAWLWSRKGGTHRENFELRPAAHAFHRALSMRQPDNDKGWCQTELADTFARFGDYDKSLKLFEEGLEHDKSYWVYMKQALAMNARGQLGNALKSLEQHVLFKKDGSKDWSHPDAAQVYVRILSRAGRYKEALQFLDEGLKAAKDDGAASFHQAKAKIYFLLLTSQPESREKEAWQRALRESASKALAEYAKKSSPSYSIMARCALLMPDEAAKAREFLEQHKKLWGQSNDPEALLLEAVMAAREDANDKARLLIAEAVSRGWYDWHRLANDPLYAPLVKLPSSAKLIEILKLEESSEAAYAAREQALAQWAAALETHDEADKQRLQAVVEKLNQNADTPMTPPSQEDAAADTPPLRGSSVD